MKDVKREIEAKNTAAKSSKEVSENLLSEEISFSRAGRIIAKRLTLSKQTKPHFYLFKDIDVTDALAWRKAYNIKNQMKISVNDMILKATASALIKFPRLNAHVTEDKIILYKYINIGQAVATDNGVLVPVIPDVNKKDIEDIILLSRETIASARKGILKTLCPGTFTISNLSMYLINSFLPIINPPECAILGIGCIEKRVVPIKENIEIRSIMTLTLACDHRAVDGVYGSRFLKIVQQHLKKFTV